MVLVQIIWYWINQYPLIFFSHQAPGIADLASSEWAAEYMSSEVQRAEGIWNLDMNVIYCLGNYAASAILTSWSANCHYKVKYKLCL